MVNEYDSAELTALDTPEDWDEGDANAALEWLSERASDREALFRKRIVEAGEDEDALFEIYREIAESVRDFEQAVEIFQWFRVDSLLADDLKAIGQPVMDGELWGRTCCGQAVVMDGTLQQCADLLFSRWPEAGSDPRWRPIILRTEAGNFAAFPEAFEDVADWIVGAEWATHSALMSVLSVPAVLAQRELLAAQFRNQSVIL